MRGLKWKIWLIMAAIVVSVVYILPSLRIFKLPDWWEKFLPKDQIHLGLDLQGGTHLILGVRTEKAIESIVEQNSGEVKDEMRRAGIGYKSVEKGADNTIRVVLVSSADKEKLSPVLDTFEQFDAKYWQEGEESGATLTMKSAQAANLKDYAVRQSLETIRNRIDQFGIAEPTIQRQGQENILVQLPGISDPQRAINLIGKTALLEFKLVDEENSVEAAQAGNIPAGDELLFQREEDKATGKVTKTAFLVKKKTLMTGDVIADATVGIDNQYGDSYVSMTFDKRGARLFEQITEANVKKRLAIILDGNVYSAPVIQEKIAGGKAQITGRFTMEEARDLAIVLRAGSLPAPVDVLEERTVGPSLGGDSIRQGLIAAAIGSLAVVMFMIIYYSFSGVIANVALILNIMLIMATLAAFKATLTLPGIAGMALTVGMAVDANVLIFERIREELSLGKTVRAALEAGYDKAFLTIVDANVTTLIAAFVLFQFGTGPVKGFAVTLSIGLLASMFTAITVTKVIFELILQNRGVKSISIG